MSSNTTRMGVEQTRIMLGLLQSVERGEAQSQRRLASELGIALGLVNAYLKRCVSKGLVKVGEAPARRYAYYLTPHGFTEKSQLMVEYLSVSLTLFRRSRADFTALLTGARAQGIHRLAMLGAGDLAEIAAICALDCGVSIVGVIVPGSSLDRFVGIPVHSSFASLSKEIDAVLIADIQPAKKTIDIIVARFGEDRILVPDLIGRAVLLEAEQAT